MYLLSNVQHCDYQSMVYLMQQVPEGQSYDCSSWEHLGPVHSCYKYIALLAESLSCIVVLFSDIQQLFITLHFTVMHTRTLLLILLIITPHDFLFYM